WHVAAPDEQHNCPSLKMSSTLPLQSLSRPSQISPTEFCAPIHSMPVGPQLSMPAVQMPVPQRPLGEHEPPTVPPGRSSGVPLQSLSRPSQISGTGPTAPWHCKVVLPGMHWSEPGKQMPTPQRSLPLESL